MFGTQTDYVRERRGHRRGWPGLPVDTGAPRPGRRVSVSTPQRGDLVVDLDEAVVLPGLINAHDHLELNSFPRLKWRPQYANVREWIADFQPRFASDPALGGRPTRHARRSRVGRRSEEPSVRRHHGVPSQPASRDAWPEVSGPRRAQVRPQPLASDRRRARGGVVSPHAARVALDYSRCRRRRRRRARRDRPPGLAGLPRSEHGARARRRAGSRACRSCRGAVAVRWSGVHRPTTFCLARPPSVRHLRIGPARWQSAPTPA